MTPAGELLAAEIAAHGPIPFSRFMEVALYDPAHGYYRGDPFGRGGDYYTAEQLQPTFGLLLARVAAGLGVTRVLQPGAGRAALAATFAGFDYQAIDIGYGAWPTGFRGLILAHELFDALPCDVAAREGDAWREQRVGYAGGRFVWSAEEAVDPGLAIDDAVDRIELPRGLQPMLARMAAAIESGYLLVIDYGFTERERIRFRAGTLMSYRRHCAIDDVLAAPGQQDITAHVPWGLLEQEAESAGFTFERRQSLASLLLAAGERDHFAGILGEDPQRAGQLKSLLFDFGESFDAVLFAKR